MPPPGPAAPGGYDFGRAAFFDGIGAVGFAYGRAEPIAPLRGATLSRANRDLRRAAALAHDRANSRGTARQHRRHRHRTHHRRSRIDLREDDEAALRDAGLAHVLAIAGLHMALVGLGLFWIVRALLAPFPHWRSAIRSRNGRRSRLSAGATFYLIISGAATPATRAFVMLAMMLIAILFDRPALSMRSVALAATIILLLRPESLIEPGFQMSFAAVVGLIAVAEWEQARRARDESSGPRSLCRRAPLCARHRDHQLGRQPRDRAVRDVPFRPRHPLRGARQSARHAGHGFCRDAGRGDLSRRHAVSVWKHGR